MHNLSKKYFYFICCFMLLTNNASAVKLGINPVQKIEAKSDSIPSALILTHRTNQRSPKRIKAGQIVKVRTKDNKTYKGKLKVIDENYIEVGGHTIELDIKIGGQKIALENIVKVKHKLKRRKMLFGLGFILTGILITFLAAATASGDTFAEIAGNFFLALFAIFIIIPIGIVILAFPIIYSTKSWIFSTKDKDGVLYRRRES